MLIVLLMNCIWSGAQDIPQHISYYRIYDLLDEFANLGMIDLNSAVKPYSRKFIAEQLLIVAEKEEKLSIRQKKEVRFFLEEFALENGRLPKGKLKLLRNEKTIATLWPPAFSYQDEIFTARITPILGMHLISNQHGTIDKRWYGAEFQSTIGKNLAVYGSLRDISHSGNAALSKASFLNNEPGYEYTMGTDFSDSRGGISYSNSFMTIGLKKDNIIWGDNYHCSNILSGRAPSFPMIHLHLKPAKWFELNYIHGWLVSNVWDSTNYYVDNLDAKHYRLQNKFMAANLFTFTPFNKLKLSVGNAIVYAEKNVLPSYFIPIAFYKSMDHVLNKGLGAENQNSQLFFNVSSRNIKHLHLYGSVYIDEFQLRRLKPDSPDKNPVSIKAGFHFSDFMLKNFSFTGEYTYTNIINYKHSIPALTFASNSYFMGHYLVDNARELYLGMKFKPIRGLDLEMSYVNALKGNDYDYIRRGFFNGVRGTIIDIISYPSPGDVIWTNKTFSFKAVYELFRNGYAIVKADLSDIQGYDATSDVVFAENRMTAQEVLNRFTPAMLHGKNTTITMGFSFGF
jgi:hypothetical protein